MVKLLYGSVKPPYRAVKIPAQLFKNVINIGWWW